MCRVGCIDHFEQVDVYLRIRSCFSPSSGTREESRKEKRKQKEGERIADESHKELQQELQKEAAAPMSEPQPAAEGPEVVAQGVEELRAMTQQAMKGRTLAWESVRTAEEADQEGSGKEKEQQNDPEPSRGDSKKESEVSEPSSEPRRKKSSSMTQRQAVLI